MAKPGNVAVTICEAPLRVNAPLALEPRLDDLLRCADAIQGPDSVRALHDTRIAVKRLRYTLEIFAAAVEGAGHFLKELKRLQDILGEMHDADVLAPLLAEDLRRDGPSAGVQALHDRTVRDRARLFDDFNAAWSALRDGDFAGRLRSAALMAVLVPGTDVPEGTPEGTAVREALAVLEIADHAAREAGPERRDHLARTLKEQIEALAAAGTEKAHADAVHAVKMELWGVLTDGDR